MKKSEVVLLTVMVGTVAALNIERQPDTVRNVYNTRENCLQDYSDNQCREDAGGSGGSGGRSRWYGPDYRNDGSARRSTYSTVTKLEWHPPWFDAPPGPRTTDRTL